MFLFDSYAIIFIVYKALPCLEAIVSYMRKKRRGRANGSGGLMKKSAKTAVIVIAIIAAVLGLLAIGGLFSSRVESLSTTDFFKKAGIEYKLYSDIKPNPTIENVQHGVKSQRLKSTFTLSPVTTKKAMRLQLQAFIRRRFSLPR